MAKQETPQGIEAFEFAGWGSASRIADLDTAEVKISHLDQPKKHSSERPAIASRTASTTSVASA